MFDGIMSRQHVLCIISTMIEICPFPFRRQDVLFILRVRFSMS